MSAEFDDLLDPGFFDELNGEFAARRAQARILDLSEIGAGRELVRVQPNTPSSIELIGYILPVNLQQTNHLVLFNDGGKIVVGPNTRETRGQFFLYLQSFHPNGSYTEIQSSDDLREIRERFFQAPNRLNCLTLFSSSVPSQQTSIELAEEQAAALMPELLRRAEVARQRALKTLLANAAGAVMLRNAASGKSPMSGWGN